MITLFASIAGFISSIIPEFFKLLSETNNKKHELDLLDRKISIQEKGLELQLESSENVAVGEESKSLYATFKSGIFWTDVLNASVRPVLAYSFFSLYATIKYMQFKMISNIPDLHQIVSTLWTIDDQAIFAGIISFYFGQWAIARRLKLK